MLTVNIHSDIKKLKKNMDRFQKKQIPHASEEAINKTMALVRKGEELEIKQSIDRPTRFTLRSLSKVFKANKQRQKYLAARLLIFKRQEEYLQYQIDGGTSVSKKGKWPIPIDKSLTNQYGNLPRGRRRLYRDKNDFYAVIKGIEGIWRRTDAGIKLRVLFKQTREYIKKPFDFYGRANRIIKKHFNKRMRLATRSKASKI